MPVLQAKVKSVLSGDRLSLTNPKGAERALSLAHVSAPRLKREGDEVWQMARRCDVQLTFNQPFAFQSREFLRELLVGKVVTFEILYTIPTTKREYGRVNLPNGPSFPERVVAEGWAKVRDDAGKKEETDDGVAYLEKLRNLEMSARNASIGVWSSGGGKIDTSYELTDPSALVEEYRGEQLDAIIEKVLTGDRLIVRSLLSPSKHIQSTLVVAGVRAPSTKRTSPDGKEIPAELYGTEAQQFVEERLLQRKCAIQLVGSTPQNQLIASVIHPRGNIAKFLLDAGLARCNDQHVTLLGNDMAAFRQAEKAAKDAGKGIFAGQTASQAGGAPSADYTIVRILNADTIFIRSRAGLEKKINLSSIRQPKPSDQKQAPFSADAKEFLRKRLIGRHVKVSIDGKKAASEGYEERDVATVTLNGKNAALLLVEAGYASVIRHRRDDEDRSPDYDLLLLAEEAAQKEGKGMWAAKPPAAKQYQDYSESLQKAKMEASVLQRQKKVPAVVDFVRSASRFVVLVPRENAKLTFVLSGIRAPKSARNPDEKSEPFGQEAHDFASRRCMQRDVEIDVENIDKVGGFIGTLYVNRENFAKLLVDEGLAEVHAYSAEQSGHSNELVAAEKKAKEARKGIWHDWDPSKGEDHSLAEEPAFATDTRNGDSTNTSVSTAPKAKDYRDVLVTHVDAQSGHLKIQQIGPGSTSLTELMASFKSFHLNPSNKTPISGPPKVGDLLAAQFSLDRDWYRARVRRVDRDAKTAEITYVDYGNSESVAWSNLRPLTQPQFSTQKLKPQAMDAVLSYIQLPTTSAQYLPDAVAYITEITDGKELVANVDHVAPDTGALHLTLLDPKSSNSGEDSINAEVVREGFAMVPKKTKAWEQKGAGAEVWKKLRELEEEAKEERRGMWEYGDLTED
jgi:staphylococcal nuclease domain-containing protein 1